MNMFQSLKFYQPSKRYKKTMPLQAFLETTSKVEKILASGCGSLFGFACNFGDRGSHQGIIITLDLTGGFC